MFCKAKVMLSKYFFLLWSFNALKIINKWRETTSSLKRGYYLRDHDVVNDNSQMFRNEQQEAYNRLTLTDMPLTNDKCLVMLCIVFVDFAICDF